MADIPRINCSMRATPFRLVRSMAITTTVPQTSTAHCPRLDSIGRSIVVIVDWSPPPVAYGFRQ
jgi:hypothetical protein